jgi:succinyl-CoA synthetase alpha subunit
MGHAGAIINSQIAELGTEVGTADSKINAFRRAKIPVADRPWQIPDLVKKALKLPTRKV